MIEIDKSKVIRDAATIVLWRAAGTGFEVLMGQRGSTAVFMPDKFVFPGGAVDEQDRHVGGSVPAPLLRQLSTDAPEDLAVALAHAAIRELWEETGLLLGRPGTPHPSPPADWRGFFEQGLVPDPSPLRFFFRAITPPGRPRRFDARFFLCPATAIAGDVDDFSQASDELRHLQWVTLEKTRHLSLPFVTEVVLSEVTELLTQPEVTKDIPFFHQGASGAAFKVIPVDSP